MIHYHGLPITPETAAEVACRAGHAFVSFAHPGQIGLAVAACQSFALDNGAFSAWKKGHPVTDWTDYYAFAEAGKRQPSCDFAVIPDVIDGTEGENDDLVANWPLPRWFGAPVWHLHESFDRLNRLVERFPRVCLGSSGDYTQIGTPRWWRRMHETMRTVCDDAGQPRCKLHGLRMLDPGVFSRFPFSSADSTNIGRNIGIDRAWVGPYGPRTKEDTVRLHVYTTDSQPAHRWRDPYFGRWVRSSPFARGYCCRCHRQRQLRHLRVQVYYDTIHWSCTTCPVARKATR